MQKDVIIKAPTTTVFTTSVEIAPHVSMLKAMHIAAGGNEVMKMSSNFLYGVL